MVKNIRKSIAVVAVVAMLVLTTMTATVSAAVFAEKQDRKVTSSPAYGTVYGLVQGKDTGVSFVCDSYSGNIVVHATLTDLSLCLHNNDYVELSYNGDDGTVLFKDDWYLYSNGDVGFVVTRNSGSGTIGGYAY